MADSLQPAIPAAPAEEGEEKAKIPYEKLLKTAKTFKAKSIRLEKENEELKSQVDSLKKGSPNNGQAKEVSGSSTDQTLFWDDISKNSAFQQRLARSATRRLLDGLSALNQAEYSMNFSTKGQLTRKAFAQWAQYSMHARWQSLDSMGAEQQKVIKELEIKHAKLKVLLARTHNANKQQAEDSNAFKRAQTAAVEELRANEQEKSVLREQLQALDMQNAFKQDIEIYIQKAAEDLLRARKEKGGAAANSTTGNAATDEEGDLHSSSSSSSSSSGDNHASAAVCAGRGAEEQERALRELQAVVAEKEGQIAALVAAERELQASLHKLTVAGERNKTHIAGLEARVCDAQKKLAAEETVRQEVELELEVTLKNQGVMVTSSKVKDDERQRKLKEESGAHIEQLRTQCEHTERKLMAAQSAMDAATDTVNEYKRVNATLKRDNAEVISLRGQIVQLRKSVRALSARKGGSSSSSGAGSSNNSTGGSAPTYNNDEAGGGSNINNIESTKHNNEETRAAVRKLVRRVRAMDGQAQSTQHALKATMRILLNIAMDNVARSVPAAVTSAASPEYTRILSKLESKVSQAQEALAKAQTLEECLKPMVWDSSKIELAPGKDIKLPVPFRKKIPDGKAMLKWSITSRAVSSLALTLQTAQGVLKLQSTQTDEVGDGNERTLIGELVLSSKYVDSIMSIENSSWSALNMGYHIELCTTFVDDVKLSTMELSKKVADEERRYNRFKDACALFFRLKDLSENMTPPTDVPGANMIGEESRKLLADLVSKLDFDIEHPHDSPEDIKNSTQTPVKAEESTYEENTDILTIQTLACESLTIKAQAETRLYLPFTVYNVPFRLSWMLEVPGEKQSKLDIGFAILQKLTDKSTPSLFPYMRVKGMHRGNLVVNKKMLHENAASVEILLDNTYSILREKSIKYSFKVEELIEGVERKKVVPDEITDAATEIITSSSPQEEESNAVVDASLEQMNGVVALMRQSFKFYMEHIVA